MTWVFLEQCSPDCVSEDDWVLLAVSGKRGEASRFRNPWQIRVWSRSPPNMCGFFGAFHPAASRRKFVPRCINSFNLGADVVSRRPAEARGTFDQWFSITHIFSEVYCFQAWIPQFFRQHIYQNTSVLDTLSKNQRKVTGYPVTQVPLENSVESQWKFSEIPLETS